MPWPDVLDLFAYWAEWPPEHVVARHLATYLGVYKPVKTRAATSTRSSGYASPDAMQALAGALGAGTVDLAERASDGTKRKMTRDEVLAKARAIGA